MSVVVCAGDTPRGPGAGMSAGNDASARGRSRSGGSGGPSGADGDGSSDDLIGGGGGGGGGSDVGGNDGADGGWLGGERAQGDSNATQAPIVLLTPGSATNVIALEFGPTHATKIPLSGHTQSDRPGPSSQYDRSRADRSNETSRGLPGWISTCTAHMVHGLSRVQQ